MRPVDHAGGRQADQQRSGLPPLPVEVAEALLAFLPSRVPRPRVWAASDGNHQVWSEDRGCPDGGHMFPTALILFAQSGTACLASGIASVSPAHPQAKRSAPYVEPYLSLPVGTIRGHEEDAGGEQPPTVGRFFEQCKRSGHPPACSQTGWPSRADSPHRGRAANSQVLPRDGVACTSWQKGEFIRGADCRENPGKRLNLVLTVISATASSQ